MPSRHPHVAAALESGEVGVDAASAITAMLDRVAVRADPALADVVEAALVDLAAHVPLELLLRGVREAEARLDHDGIEPREDQLRQERSLTIREDRNGMMHLHARLDPENAAPVKAAIEALTSDVLRRREPTACEPHPVLDDHRSIPQIQADALAALARHTLGCTQTLTPLAKTTVVVRMNLDTLLDGLGHARIDGIEQPISAATARRMAADAELIPAVLGGDSVPLDLGRTARLFTRAQRLALGERDGGCASCGQNITYVQAHHIQLVGTRHRTHRPRQRSPALQLLPPHHPPRSMGHPSRPHPRLVHPTTTHRPHTDPTTRRTSTIRRLTAATQLPTQEPHDTQTRRSATTPTHAFGTSSRPHASTPDRLRSEPLTTYER